MSLGTSNAYHAVWPLGAGSAGLGSCLCGGGGDVFYDVLAIGGGHGGDDASLTRDFALPPKLILLVGEFTKLRDRRWNDTPGASSWTTTQVDTTRIAKVYLRDTGQGCAHPQVDMKFAESAGFTGPPRRICRNWQPVGTGGNPPCEVFVYSVAGFPNPPTALLWSVAARTINGTPFAAESISSPAHKLGIGGTNWKGEDDFQAGWTSFRYPGYGTPGSTHAAQCTREAFDAGLRGSARELCFVDAFGRTGGGVRFYDGAGAFSFAQLSYNNIYSAHPQATSDVWTFTGTGGALVAPGTTAEAVVVTAIGVALVPSWPAVAGGVEDATDSFWYPAATNAAGGYAAGDIALLRIVRVGSWQWNGVASVNYTGGLTLDGTGSARGAQSWNQEQNIVGGSHFFDCDADGRLYFGVNVTSLAGSSVSGYQLFRVDRLGTNPVQLGTFWKNGVEGYVFGFVVLADPAYGGSGISHALVVGDFDAYSPPTGATSTAMVSGLNGMAILSLRDGQDIGAQTFWPGRFRTGTTTINTGDWLPGPIVEV